MSDQSQQPTAGEFFSGETEDDLISAFEQSLAGGMGAAPEEQPSFIGVSPDAITIGPNGEALVPSPNEPNADILLPADPNRPVGPDNLAAFRKLRWTDADVFGPMARSGGEIAELQDQLVSAGLLTRGSFVRGIWDKPSQDAFGALLGYSNVSGRDPEDLIVQFSGLTEEAKERRRNAARAAAQLVRPDPDTIAQSVVAGVQNTIGRKPTRSEWDELTAKMTELSVQEAQANVSAQIAQDEAIIAAEGGADVGPTTVQDVDADASFDQFLQTRFADTIKRNERVEDVAVGRDNIFRQIGTIDRIMGGTR